MEKKKQKKPWNRKKLWIVFAAAVIILCSAYGIARMVFAEEYDVITWGGDFEYTTTDWGYRSKSYAIVTLEDANGVLKDEAPVTLYSGEYKTYKHGFIRDDSGEYSKLKMDQNELYAYLKNVCGWDIKIGDVIRWQADAQITCKYNALDSGVHPWSVRTFPNVDTAYAENDTDRTIRRQKIQRMFPNNDFTNWEPTGAVYFELLMKDKNNKVVGYCHHFNDLGHWGKLKKGNYIKVDDSIVGKINVTIQYVSTEGEKLKTLPSVEKANGSNIAYSADSSLTYNGSTYNFTTAKWETATRNGTASTEVISIPECEEDVVITCYYEKEKPPVVPGENLVTVLKQFYKTNSETGEQTLEDAVSTTETVTEGSEQSFEFPLSEVANGNNYTITSCTVNFGYGLVSEKGGTGYIVSGTITGDATITIVYNREFAPEPHVCTFGDWKYDETIHWKECTECSKKGEEGDHVFVKSEVDSEGNYTETCEVCGYAKNGGEPIHAHSWSGWCPTEWWSPHLDEETMHWKVCTYCDLLGPSGPHEAGEPVKEGGYYVTRCIVCQYIMKMEPITVTLTLNPNGGAFPDGTTQMKSFTLQYLQTTSMGDINPEYMPENDSAGVFQGYYIVTPYFEGVFYNEQGIGGSQYFKDNGNGTYTCYLTEDYTVHAQYRQGEHVVTYNANGAGEGIMFPSYFKLNTSGSLSPNSFGNKNTFTYDTDGVEAVVDATLANTQKYWTFAGWGLTKEDGVKYTNGQSVTFTRAGSTELFAKWNYGTITLPNAHAANDGMKLYGWKTADGTVVSVLDAAGNFKNTTYSLSGKDETFTAVWTPNTYNVTFECMHGTAHHSKKQVTYKQPYGTLPVCDGGTGYTFKGWKHKDTGADVVAESIVTTAGNHTLVAQYDRKNVTVTLDYNFDLNKVASAYKKNSDYLSELGLKAVSTTRDSFVIPYGEAVGTLPIPEMEGYQFAGWFTEETSNNACGEAAHEVYGYTVPNAMAVTYYAYWTRDQYRVDLDYNNDYTVWEEE